MEEISTTMVNMNKVYGLPNLAMESTLIKVCLSYRCRPIWWGSWQACLVLIWPTSEMGSWNCRQETRNTIWSWSPHAWSSKATKGSWRQSDSWLWRWCYGPGPERQRRRWAHTSHIMSSCYNTWQKRTQSQFLKSWLSSLMSYEK